MGKVWIGLASGVWSFLSLSARASAQMGLLKSTRLDSKVISVGNIQVGGAGKTPLVAQIAHEAIQRGHRVCILTRGYKSQWELEGGVIPPGLQAVDAAQCGDEAALLHDLCPGAYLGVGADRVKQYQEVLNHLQRNSPSAGASRPKIDVILLDDGFQHWSIQKDIEVVALTSAQSNDVLFRDFPQALRNADLLVWTKGEKRPAVAGTPLVVIQYRLPRPPEGPSEGGAHSYCLVTGLAQGKHVLSLATQSGYSIVQHLEFPDHVAYTREQVLGLIQEFSQKQLRILMTGKDWVKWRSLGVTQTDAIVVIEPELVFQEGKDLWSQVLWGE